jgi:hypothetical protein
VLIITGKGENIWDKVIHEDPSMIIDGTNADVASDSYHKWQDDVELLKSIGVSLSAFVRVFLNNHNFFNLFFFFLNQWYIHCTITLHVLFILNFIVL